MATYVGDDLLQYLEVQSYGVRGETLFLDSMPAKPNNIVVVFSSSPSGVQLKIPDLRYVFQIRVRNKNYEDARRIINSIFNKLDNGTGKQSIVLSNNRRVVVLTNTPPYFLMEDNVSRYHWIYNFSILTRRD
jgi:hypothetical protein